MNEEIADQNYAKIAQLHPDVQWAAQNWLAECWKLNIKFRILESYRSQQRQNALYNVGRRGIKGERPVTWTRSSNHTKRLACDVLPINCTYDDIAQVAEDYGITHPFTKGDLIDLPHFEFTHVVRKPFEPTVPPPAPLSLSPNAEMKAFARGIERLSGTAKKRAEERFVRKYGKRSEEVIRTSA